MKRSSGGVRVDLRPAGANLNGMHLPTCAAPMALAILGAGCGQPPLEPRDPTPGMPHFKVASYNVEYGKSHDASTVAAIGAASADIVALQEVTPRWEAAIVDAYAAEYPHRLFHVTSDVSAGGLAVLSRFPVYDQGVRPSPVDGHPAWHVLVETNAGAVQLLNVHLRSAFSSGSNAVSSYLSTGDDHVSEIADFSAQCQQEYPTIVAGDFNEGPDGSAIGRMESEGYRNVLPLYRPGQYTWRHRSVAGQLTKTLDHILFDDTLEPLNAWVENTGHSDHLPLAAHFEPAYHW